MSGNLESAGLFGAALRKANNLGRLANLKKNEGTNASCATTDSFVCDIDSNVSIVSINENVGLGFPPTEQFLQYCDPLIELKPPIDFTENDLHF